MDKKTQAAGAFAGVALAALVAGAADAQSSSASSSTAFGGNAASASNSGAQSASAANVDHSGYSIVTVGGSTQTATTGSQTVTNRTNIPAITGVIGLDVVAAVVAAAPKSHIDADGKCVEDLDGRPLETVGIVNEPGVIGAIFGHKASMDRDAVPNTGRLAAMTGNKFSRACHVIRKVEYKAAPVQAAPAPTADTSFAPPAPTRKEYQPAPAYVVKPQPPRG